MPRECKRSHQPASRNGLGIQFTSPIKQRSAKAKVAFKGYAHIASQEHLKAKLQALLDSEQGGPNITEPRGQEEWVDINESPQAQEEWVDTEPLHEADRNDLDVNDESDSQPPPLHRRILPNKAANRLYTRWAGVLPELVNPLLTFLSASIGKKQVIPNQSILSTCYNEGACPVKTHLVLGLYFEREYLLN